MGVLLERHYACPKSAWIPQTPRADNRNRVKSCQIERSFWQWSLLSHRDGGLRRKYWLRRQLSIQTMFGRQKGAANHRQLLSDRERLVWPSPRPSSWQSG